MNQQTNQKIHFYFFILVFQQQYFSVYPISMSLSVIFEYCKLSFYFVCLSNDSDHFTTMGGGNISL